MNPSIVSYPNQELLNVLAVRYVLRIPLIPFLYGGDFVLSHIVWYELEEKHSPNGFTDIWVCHEHVIIFCFSLSFFLLQLQWQSHTLASISHFKTYLKIKSLEKSTLNKWILLFHVILFS